MKHLLGFVVSILILGGCQSMTYEPMTYTHLKSEYFSNPLQITNIGDPFVLKASDGLYYCYPTSQAENGYRVWVSEDLVDWTVEPMNAYSKTRDGWAGSDFWAPEVYEWDGKFYMYYTARSKALNSLRIGLAISDSPIGPFTDIYQEPLFDFGYAAIDAHVYVEANGQAYLYYSRDCSENRVEGRNESHIYGIRLSEDRMGVEGDPILLSQPDQDWEKASGDWRWNEGAYVIENQGSYYLMYSSNFYADRHYAIGYAVADHPLGPYTKYEHNPIVFAEDHRREISGPGHHSIISSPDDSKLYIVYHTHTVPALGGGNRQVALDTMGFYEDGRLFVNGPTLGAQLRPDFFSRVLDKKGYGIFLNDKETEVLSNGAYRVYESEKIVTPAVDLEDKDVIEIRFKEPTEISGLVIYSGPTSKRLDSIELTFSHGYGIEGLAFPENDFEPADVTFEPIVVEWIQIRKSEKSQPGILSEIIVF